MRGGCCQNLTCDFADWDLQFAHLRPTGIRGRSRGGYARMLDLRRHASAYALLCRTCHLAFDRGVELVLTVREVTT